MKYSHRYSSLARFIIRVQSAVVALTRDHDAALESLRLVNKELLVTAFSEVPDAVAATCDKARAVVLEAVRLLDPLPAGTEPSLQELPPGVYRALVARNVDKFSPVIDPPGLN